MSSSAEGFLDFVCEIDAEIFSFLGDLLSIFLDVLILVFGLVALVIVEWWRAPAQAHVWRDEPLYALLDRLWAACLWTKAFLARPLQPKKKRGAQDTARAVRE